MRLRHVAPVVEGLTTSVLWNGDDIQRRKVSLENVRQHLPYLTEAILLQYADEVLVFFWARSTFFRVVYNDAERPATSFAEYANQSRPTVQDESGNSIGFVCKTGTGRRDDQLQEFVAIGERQILGVPEDMIEDICPPVILVLQIERDKYGISSRINCAEINSKAWMYAEPKETLVVLQ